MELPIEPLLLERGAKPEQIPSPRGDAGRPGMVHLTEEERERYKRQMTLTNFGEEAQEKLRNSTVLVAGIGGLGGTAAFYMAAAGVGKMIFIHEGDLTVSNLNRQLLMTQDWIGKSRVSKGAETIRNFNPHVEVEVYDEPVEYEKLKKLLEGVDLVMDCRHNFPERRVINRACVDTGTPMVESAMNSMEATLFNVIPGETPCLHCLFEEDPQWDPYGFSVLGAHSGALGCMTAVEGVKILTGFAPPLKDRMLFFDLGKMDFRKLKIRKNPSCPVCSHRQKG